MIPQPYITAWATHAPWPSESQIEQDLLLSRLIVEIANHELLASELAFRGGTCLHKLHLPQPARYSEDLDYTRTSDEPKIGDCLTALRRIAADIGLHERKRRFPSHDSDMARIWFHTDPQADDVPISIKIEINVHETTHTNPTSCCPTASTPAGGAQVPTYGPSTSRRSSPPSSAPSTPAARDATSTTSGSR